MARVSLLLFGEFSAEALDGGRIGPLTRKPRSLLACLAMDHPTAQSRRRLSGLLWPDLDEMAARTNLRQAMAAVRRELGDVLDADKDTVALRPHVFQIDVAQFEALAGSSSAEDQERAIGLYRGVLLEGFEADVPGLDQALSSARERLHQMFMVLGTRVLANREASGQMDAAVLLAMQLVASDPLREDAHRALMRLLARQGRVTAAMKQYQTCRQLLQRELGVSPDPRTEALHRELLESRRMVSIVADGGLCDDVPGAVAGEPRVVPRLGEEPARSTGESDKASRTEDPIDAPLPEQAVAGSGGINWSDDARDSAAEERDTDSSSAGRDTVEDDSQPARMQVSVATSPGAAASNAQQTLWLPFKPSIAVLPFNNMSGDPDQEFVADGLAEDLITALSRIHWLFVSARNSSFSFKGTSASVGEVARVLGVRYVVEGSVRKAGNRIRVTAQLIDAETGNHVWATRYDREMTDIFAIQDEISEAFVAAIEPEIGQIERTRARRKPPESLDGWEHYQRGLWHLYKFTAPDNAEAKRLLQRAIKLDPGFGPAHAGLGYAYFLDTIMGFGSSDRSIQDSYRAVRQAITLDDRDGHAHYTLGRLYMLLGDPEQAYAQSQRAVELNPSLAVAHFGLGHALMLIGRAEDAVAEFDAAIRLSPRDPVLWAFECTKSHALILLRRYGEAVNWARRSVRHPTAGVWAYIALACALGHADDQQHARIALAELLEIKPDCTLNFIMNYLPFVRQSDAEHYAAGLIKAGFSEART